MNAPIKTEIVPDTQPQCTTLNFENTSQSATKYKQRIISMTQSGFVEANSAGKVRLGPLDDISLSSRNERGRKNKRRRFRALPPDRYQNGNLDGPTLRDEASHRILDPGPISNPTHAPLLSQDCGGS